MKENRGLIFKLIFLGGVLMMFIYAFLPLISSGEDKNIAMWSLTWVNSLEGGKEELLEELLGGFIDLEGEGVSLKFLVFIPVLLFWIPLIIQIISGVLLFVKKDTKTITGMVIVNTAYTFLMNLILFVGIRAAVKGMGDTDDVIKSGIVGFIIFMAGVLICLIMAIIVHLKNPSSQVFSNESGASLMCVAGEMAGAKVPLYDGQPVIIGRSSSMATFVVSDDYKLSRKHCSIEYMEDEDRVYVTDYSTNGTMLGDGSRLSKNVKTPVARGTLIILSPTTKFTVGD